nr:hypothetical protein [Tanacetum cinerariifolium]
EAVNDEMDDSLEKAATTATSLDAEQDRGGGPMCQEAMRDTAAQTRSKKMSKNSNDPLLAEVNTPQSGKDSLKLTELMELCINLQLEKKNEGLGEEDAFEQGRIADIDTNEDITLVSTHNEQMFDVDQDLVTTVATTPTILIDEATLAQALTELMHTNPKTKAKGIIFHEPEESTTTTTAAIPKLRSQDKGKAKMFEEPVKLKKKDQIQLDKEVVLKLQAELQAKFDKEQRLTAERAQQEVKANIASIES